FEAAGISCEFVQDNQSKSRKGVLRGLHFQKVHQQAKLVRVIKGEVYDVAVDLRRGSPTWGRYIGVTLSDKNRKQFFIPKGFAHGFLVLSEEAEFVYKCDELYHPEEEGGIPWNDPAVGVRWPLDGIGEPCLSEKDRRYGHLVDCFL
ncbi:MAG: dTDP-4-dehydrorhamnose 3,5-epimerase, partial [Sphaerochaetaceae bacterium]|nr:dTDP-4-dehydrorhamnose 3,5-epimerase [Sphaerochaetaceae bacterium]